MSPQRKQEDSLPGRIGRFLRRRELRQARKHNQWLEAHKPRLEAREWQGGSQVYYQAITPIRALKSEEDDMPGGRLTLTSGVPVPSADVSGSINLYYTPYTSDQITLYDGVTAQIKQCTFIEQTCVIPAPSNTVFDIFAWESGGVVSTESVNWANDTTRAIPLAYANGFLCKSTNITRRYIGTCRTTAIAGQIDDTVLNRTVFNFYNRVNRPVRVLENTNSWTYSLSVYRAANGSNANRVNVLQGIAEDAILLSLRALFTTDQAAIQGGSAAIGLDSTTTSDSNQIGKRSSSSSTSPTALMTAELHEIVPLGYHFYQWLEAASGTGITTWYGNGGNNSITQAGMSGIFRA